MGNRRKEKEGWEEERDKESNKTAYLSASKGQGTG